MRCDYNKYKKLYNYKYILSHIYPPPAIYAIIVTI